MDLRLHIHHVIAGRGLPRAVEILLKLGADIEELDNEGRTPLALVVDLLHKSIAMVLVDNHVDASSLSLLRRNICPRGHIHKVVRAGHQILLRLLLEMCLDDKEELDSGGRTPLAVAAWRYDEEMCQLLIEKGANTVNSRYKNI